MQSSLRIGALDEQGRGRVAGTVVTCEGLASIAGMSRNQISCDLVEIRYDHLGGCEQWEQNCRRLAAQGVPLLFTVRSNKEGGKWDAGDQARLPVYKKALEFAAAVDVEFQSYVVDEVAGFASAANRTLLLSYHNFAATPPLEELLEIYKAAAKIGGIVKISTMVNGEEDIRTLEALLQYRTEVPLCVIGMGPKATHTRISFAQKGSCLTYGYLDEPGAPGQLSAAELCRGLAAKA